jgi:hypothetical protein
MKRICYRIQGKILIVKPVSSSEKDTCYKNYRKSIILSKQVTPTTLPLTCSQLEEDVKIFL